jgi:phosphosulfolactate synthase
LQWAHRASTILTICAARLALYRRHVIRPFIGGQFQEYVFATYGEKMLRTFLLEARRVGFDVAEVSDNCVPLTPSQRRAQIRLAIDCGLAVFGEVGSKDMKNDARLLVRKRRIASPPAPNLYLSKQPSLSLTGSRR